MLDKLDSMPVVPLVQADDIDTALNVTRALVEGGLSVVEVVLRTEAALECLEAVAAGVPEATVGAGTVLSSEQAEASIEAGAAFIVSPGLYVPVVEAAQAADIPAIPGVATASEVQLGWNMGLRALKFFPASLAGGPLMLKALGSAYRDVRFMPTGGVTAANLSEYLALPNVIACGGSWLTPMSAIEAGYYERITQLASEAMAIANVVRGNV
ncbi:MAG: bifunctional 4-hydroxy-2-oxoglutarate aldolase/2-dehydro-3-deoxy-phosphogluconate aldolase [Xanthomonadales bacterium]|nr:bifunctional 4-hydroxy-2-oxoglutarate aldolase/2-dehydro-3-deoxy-phosphogluconate aldolase [Xanthomonadales bacterium]